MRLDGAGSSSNSTFHKDCLVGLLDEDFYHLRLCLSPVFCILALSTFYLYYHRRFFYLLFLGFALLFRCIEDAITSTIFEDLVDEHNDTLKHHFLFVLELCLEAIPEVLYAQTYYFLMILWIFQGRLEKSLASRFDETFDNTLETTRRSKRNLYALGLVSSLAALFVYILSIGFLGTYDDNVHYYSEAGFFGALGAILVLLTLAIFIFRSIVGSLWLLTGYLIICFSLHSAFLCFSFFFINKACNHNHKSENGDDWRIAYGIIWFYLQIITEVVPAAVINLIVYWLRWRHSAHTKHMHSILLKSEEWGGRGSEDELWGKGGKFEWVRHGGMIGNVQEEVEEEESTGVEGGEEESERTSGGIGRYFGFASKSEEMREEYKVNKKMASPLDKSVLKFVDDYREPVF